jgi:hypothetical protein
VTLHKRGVARLWLAYGQVGIDGGGPSQYDRDLRYWITEGVFDLGVLSSVLDRFYLAGRYSEFGTFDSDEGYLIDVMYLGTRLGFNTEHVSQISAGIGFRVSDRITLKTEYSWFDFDLVRGVPDSLRDLADDKDVFRVGLSLDL